MLEQHVSVLIASWIRALGTHLTELKGLRDPAPPDRDLVGEVENAHAIAALAMLVFIIESKMSRLASISRSAPLGDSATEALMELQVVRNAVVHNHVWEVNVEASPDLERYAIVGSDPITGHFERTAFTKHVDLDQRRTVRHRLHVIPTEVRRSDVLTGLPLAVGVLDELNRFDVKNMPSPSDHFIKVAGKVVRLRSVSF